MNAPTTTIAPMDIPTLQAASRAEWRAWLQDNCETAEEVALVLRHARSATPSVSHGEAIEEALRFGWVDSRARKRDAGSWCLRFTPRNPRSAWGNVNRELVERLNAQGLMTVSVS